MITFVSLFLVFFILVKPYIIPDNDIEIYSLLLIVILNVLLIMAAGNIHNDLCDILPDQLNKPEKRVVDRYISPLRAKSYYFLLTGLAGILSINIFITTKNLILFSIFLFSIIALYIYSKHAKSWVFWGNFIIAILCTLVFIIIPCAFSSTMVTEWWSNEEILLPVTIFGIFAFLTTLTRELVKDLADVKGDMAAHIKTIPISWSESTVRIYGLSLFTSLVVLLLLTGFLVYHRLPWISLIYISGLITTTIYCALKFKSARTHSDFSNLSRGLKIYIFQGIILLVFWL
jgi:4-hydroxybenzoate polyprenyltransferase